MCLVIPNFVTMFFLAFVWKPANWWGAFVGFVVLLAACLLFHIAVPCERLLGIIFRVGALRVSPSTPPRVSSKRASACGGIHIIFRLACTLIHGVVFLCHPFDRHGDFCHTFSLRRVCARPLCHNSETHLPKLLLRCHGKLTLKIMLPTLQLLGYIQLHNPTSRLRSPRAAERYADIAVA